MPTAKRSGISHRSATPRSDYGTPTGMSGEQPRCAGMQYERLGPGQHTCEPAHVRLAEHFGRQGGTYDFSCM
ncbi:hypothetical protein [Myxococcus sp. NMCA1]|uniref:hypothetical protein n=1 Tax=Myxococcus sp. NMCA1 TaxID=2996785 RepID=UPI00228622D5|nr:hypothetical protein [Myxococcus sp. NMCA1]WAM24417.1 hypothetical protein OZ403_28285 [Myxococcus sp. NMCA1]